MSRDGVEPSTQGFSVLCSNQLSYLDDFKTLQLIEVFNTWLKRKNISGVKGFEPLNVGSKFRCLTTWRHPIYV